MKPFGPGTLLGICLAVALSTAPAFALTYRYTYTGVATDPFPNQLFATGPGLPQIDVDDTSTLTMAFDVTAPLAAGEITTFRRQATPIGMTALSASLDGSGFALSEPTGLTFDTGRVFAYPIDDRPDFEVQVLTDSAGAIVQWRLFLEIEKNLFGNPTQVLRFRSTYNAGAFVGAPPGDADSAYIYTSSAGPTGGQAGVQWQAAGASNGSWSMSEISAAVPGPASLPLLVTALAAAGLLVRRRQGATRPA